MKRLVRRLQFMRAALASPRSDRLSFQSLGTGVHRHPYRCFTLPVSKGQVSIAVRFGAGCAIDLFSITVWSDQATAISVTWNDTTNDEQGELRLARDPE